MIITIKIDDSKLKEIHSVYNNKSYSVVDSLVRDVLERYFNTEYYDPSIPLRPTDDLSVDKYLINEIEVELKEILNENEICECGEPLIEIYKMLDMSLPNISEYRLGRISALAEMYFNLTGEVNKYGSIIEQLNFVTNE